MFQCTAMLQFQDFIVMLHYHHHHNYNFVTVKTRTEIFENLQRNLILCELESWLKLNEDDRRFEERSALAASQVWLGCQYCLQ